jgi:hypothetical protein
MAPLAKTPKPTFFEAQLQSRDGTASSATIDNTCYVGWAILLPVLFGIVPTMVGF